MPEMQSNPAPARKRWGLRFAFFFGITTALLAYATYWLANNDHQQRQNIKQLQAQLQSQQSAAAQDAANLRAFADVVAAPDTASITLQQQPGEPPGQAHVLYNARMGLAVYSGQISPPPADKSYQLWMTPASGAPVSGGVVSANQQTGVVVVHLQPGTTAREFSVTMEPAGGSAQPTGPKVLSGAANS